MAAVPDDLAATYLRALATADVDLVVGLFAEDAVVHSPLYGPLPPREFYPALFADTGQANLTLRSVMSGMDTRGRATMSFWFHFDWRLPSGVAAPFEVVDVATLDAEGLVEELRIVYDTVEVRPAFEAEVGHLSWRAPRP
ncbi:MULTISPECIES: nuclear transport factor 2 family protein [unclassified Nocardioides]|uniref:nuclear transport factor 2 family protein n=1 Tax=unclassified Nocardioides TaxID=2615069 RepID=UPI0030150FEF